MSAQPLNTFSHSYQRIKLKRQCRYIEFCPEFFSVLLTHVVGAWLTYLRIMNMASISRRCSCKKTDKLLIAPRCVDTRRHILYVNKLYQNIFTYSNICKPMNYVTIRRLRSWKNGLNIFMKNVQITKSNFILWCHWHRGWLHIVKKISRSLLQGIKQTLSLSLTTRSPTPWGSRTSLTYCIIFEFVRNRYQRMQLLRERGPF